MHIAKWKAEFESENENETKMETNETAFPIKKKSLILQREEELTLDTKWELLPQKSIKKPFNVTSFENDSDLDEHPQRFP